MSTVARSVRTLLMLALSTVLAGALLAGVLLPWVGGPALLARNPPACSATPPRADRRAAAGQHHDARRERGADHLVLRAEPRPGDQRADRAGHEARDGGDRGRAVLRAQRAGRRGHAAGAGQEHRGRRGAGGRLDAHPAAGQADAAAVGGHAGGAGRGHRGVGRPQAPRGAAGPGARGHVQQGRDPHPVPQHRLLRAERLRHPGRCPRLLRHRRLGLDVPQAALLAGLVQSPTHDNPFVTPEGATVRRNQVLTRMAAQGYITPEEKTPRSPPRSDSRRHPPRDAAASRPASARTSATSCSAT